MKYRILLITPIYILVFALFFSNIYKQNVINASNQEVAITHATKAQLLNNLQPEIYYGIPTGLYIPSLGIRLSVKEGSYDIASQTWTLSSDSAHFATQTSKANNDIDGGLTLLYGHNTDVVLGATKNIENGDIIEIYTENKMVFAYSYIGDEIVQPEDTKLFEYTGEPRLVLMSCTGQWNESRRIMNFELLSVHKQPAV